MLAKFVRVHNLKPRKLGAQVRLRLLRRTPVGSTGATGEKGDAATSEADPRAAVLRVAAQRETKRRFGGFEVASSYCWLPTFVIAS